MYRCLSPGCIGVKLPWAECLPLARDNGFEGIDVVRALPGETGGIDLAGFRGALRTIGYDGPVVPEPFVKELADLAPDEAVRRVGDALAKVR